MRWVGQDRVEILRRPGQRRCIAILPLSTTAVDVSKSEFIAIESHSSRVSTQIAKTIGGGITDIFIGPKYLGGTQVC